MSEYFYAMENLYKPTEPTNSGSVTSKSNENTLDGRVTPPDNPNAVESTAQGDLDYRNSEFETIDLITLPTDPVESTHDNSFTECYPQFVAVLPGILILLATGMQQCWAIIEYDMALWKKMNVDNVSAYALDVFVVCCWYCGAIIGYFVGTFAVINVEKRTIYLIAAFLLIVSGECLKNCFALSHHIIGRTLLGCVHSMTHLAVISYASEATTKKIRTGLLSFAGYINTMSLLIAIAIASLPNLKQPQFDPSYKLDMNESETEFDPTYKPDINDFEIEPNIHYVQEIISCSAAIIMIMGVAALLLAPFATRESIPFLVRKRQHDRAYKEYLTLRSASRDKIVDIRSDFEHWKVNILSAPRHNTCVFKKTNMEPLRVIMSTRLLSLLFNSILMTTVFIRLLDYDDGQEIHRHLSMNSTADEYSAEYVIDFLFGAKSFQIVIGLGFVLMGLRCRMDRFCYKLSFGCGLCLCFLYIIYNSIYFLVDVPDRILISFMCAVNVVYLMMPFKIEILHYQQISEAYQEGNNNFKIWSLVFVGCCENLIQILLLLNIFLFISYGILLTGFGIVYISFWLLRNMPNSAAINPTENALRNARKWEYLKHTHTVHM